VQLQIVKDPVINLKFLALLGRSAVQQFRSPMTLLVQSRPSNSALAPPFVRSWSDSVIAGAMQRNDASCQSRSAAHTERPPRGGLSEIRSGRPTNRSSHILINDYQPPPSKFSTCSEDDERAQLQCRLCQRLALFHHVDGDELGRLGADRAFVMDQAVRYFE
jgi:hypothetical protein